MLREDLCRLRVISDDFSYKLGVRCVDTLGNQDQVRERGPVQSDVFGDNAGLQKRVKQADRVLCE